MVAPPAVREEYQTGMYVTLRPLWRTLVTKLKIPVILVPFKEYFIR